MRYIKILLLLGCLSCLNSTNAQQLPPYYFDIDEVYNTPYYSQEKSKNGYVVYRVLKIQVEEYSFLAVEYIEQGKGELPKAKLKGYYYLDEKDFDHLAINDMKELNWKSAQTFELILGDEECYLVKLGKQKEVISIDKCD